MKVMATSPTVESLSTHIEQKKIINKDIGLHTKQYEREWGRKVGWRKRRMGRLGGFSCIVAVEAICLEESGYLPSPVPPFFSIRQSPLPSPLSTAQTSACLFQCPSEDISAGLMCSPVIFHWPEYAQILSRVSCVDLGDSPQEANMTSPLKGCWDTGLAGTVVTCIWIVFLHSPLLSDTTPALTWGAQKALPKFLIEKRNFYFHILIPLTLTPTLKIVTKWK